MKDSAILKSTDMHRKCDRERNQRLEMTARLQGKEASDITDEIGKMSVKASDILHREMQLLHYPDNLTEEYLQIFVQSKKKPAFNHLDRVRVLGQGRQWLGIIKMVRQLMSH